MKPEVSKQELQFIDLVPFLSESLDYTVRPHQMPDADQDESCLQRLLIGLYQGEPIAVTIRDQPLVELRLARFDIGDHKLVQFSGVTLSPCICQNFELPAEGLHLHERIGDEFVFIAIRHRDHVIDLLVNRLKSLNDFLVPVCQFIEEPVDTQAAEAKFIEFHDSQRHHQK